VTRSPSQPVGALIVGACVLMLAACGRNSAAPEQGKAAGADEQFAALEHEYVVYFMSRFPVVATYLGGAALDETLRDIDGKLRDHSAAALAEEDKRWSEFRDRFTALDPQGLSPRRQIDRTVALAQIEFLLHQHQTRRYQERALDTYVDEPFRGVDWQIQGMTSTGADRYGTESEWRHVIARTNAVPAYLNAAERQIAAGVAAQNTPDWRLFSQNGLQSAVANAEYFSKTLPAIAKQNLAPERRDAILRDIQSAGNTAADAYMHLRDFIATTFYDDASKPGIEGVKAEFREDRYVAGEAEYDWALKNNLRLQTTAAQLFEEAQPIVDRTREEMIVLARKIAASHRWKVPEDGPSAVRAVFAQLSNDAPKTDDEMIESYRKTGVRLVDFARRTGLFAVPEDYRLAVSVTPPPLRSSIDGAAYYPAPAFKKTGIGRFYVTPTDNNLAELRQQHNRAALADLAAHEDFPGHDWHYKVMSEHRDKISPVRWLTPGAVEDSSSMWQDSMAAEGWALYSEALLAEPQAKAPKGFYTPEERLYQLRGKLYRDLRVRIDTGLHTNRISFEDAVPLFSEVVDFLPGSCTDDEALADEAKRASCDSARGAIMRYARWPTQAITYRLGKDQIFALRQRAESQLGAKFSLQKFHLAFMEQGTIPAAYFADELLKDLSQ
jgi:uncharacterized protein (DUF885 family)